MRVISDEMAARLKDGPVLSATCKREVANAILNILQNIGEDPGRDGLRETPARVAQMYDELLVGYTIDPDELLNDALFDVEYDEMVVARDIELFSLCEHHLLPIVGRAHVAYIPHHKVVGFSKLPRIVDMFARRLQVQERMTRQIADFLNELIRPRGVAVVIEAAHLCTIMRGVKKPHSRMLTSAVLGVFRQDPRTREEFMAHIQRRGADSLT